MIELPTSPAPNAMEAALLDRGFIQRGGSSLRIDRPGSRFRVAIGYAPMEPATARRFLARIKRAKREGLRIPLPLLEEQGIPGAPQVDGADQAGTALAVRGLTPAYIVKEDFWLTIVDADGTAYLHSVAETAVADAAGLAVLQIEPPLRAPFPDGAVIELRRPFIEGFIDGEEWGWQVPLMRRISPGFTIEEFR